MSKSKPKTRRHPHANPRGILSITPSGFGFVQTAEGSFFIPASKIGGAFDGDMVEVSPAHVNYGRSQPGKQHNRPGERPTARVVSVVERAHRTIVGRYEVADPFGVVVPSDHRIPYDVFTMRADSLNIPEGSIVRVRIDEYPSRHNAATGTIEEVLGAGDDTACDIESVIAKYRLETRFSEASVQQAAAAEVDVAGALAGGYRDERDRFVFTVDPVDARDFDDALSLVNLGSGLWRLGIHIADVSYYVPWDSSIDFDARRRATSVYLPDRVIPMLPERLSGDICSLVPRKPRRAMTVDVVLDDLSQIRSVDVHASVIESKARLSYEHAACYLDAIVAGDGWREAAAQTCTLPEPSGFVPLEEEDHRLLFNAFSHLILIARARQDARHDAGGVDFDTVEAKVVLDEEGAPCDVAIRSKTPASSCIEEAMILANECVARRLLDTQTPGIFRVHEAPSAESLAALVPVLQEFDCLGTSDAGAFVAGDPHALQKALEQARGRSEAALVSSLVLRSMQRAVYKPFCSRHYGLASSAYCHFTSPIRRYPDVVVHRMLKVLLSGSMESSEQQCEQLPWLAEHSSKMERLAESAAREAQELELVEYMRQFVGLSFPGTISGVATYGIFVRLENTAEGLVPVRSLGDDYYALDPVLHKLTGQDGGMTYRLGQSVRVVLVAAPEHTRRLDMRLVVP